MYVLRMDSTRYLAVANYQDSVSSHNTDSKIYRWDGSSFTEFQTLATNGAWWWEAFTIDGTHYLAVANTHNDVTHDIDSKIYRFDGSSFIEFQSLATSGAREWEVFTIDGAHYLAVANGYTEDSWTHNTNSKIYRWDGSSFAEFQTLATNGACGWEAFTISGTQYLAVANNYNDKSYSIDSKIYRWDGSSFVEFQSLATNGAHGWEAFTLDGGHYLVVANSYNGASHSTDSKIYRWDGSVFAEFQALATHGALGWKAFAIDGTQYLAVANNYNDASYNIDSKIYRWDGSSFAEFQTWATNGAWCWEAFTIDDTQYLAVANYYSDSIIYTLTITTTTISTSFTTSTSTSSTSLTSTTTATRSSTSTSVTSTSTTTSSNSLTSTTTATRSSTSTSVTSSTSITSTTTRTEGPSALESSQFVFADAGAWCLGFLALYLLAIAVVLLMAHLWAKTGEPTQHPIGHPTPENDEPQESQEHQKFQEPHSQGQQTEEATPGKANQEREEMPISRMIRRSPYVLALNMVLESGNLVSSLLYVTEAYQRSALIGFSSACGSGVLVPLKAWNCPSETAALHLPACHNSLALGEWCEADSEVASPDCQVETDLDNCGKFDVYTMQMPPCADIGCPTLATGLWFFALLSLVLTIAWTAAFYTRTLLKRLVLQQQWRMRAFVFMTVLGIQTIIIYMVGFVGGSSSVLAMAFLNPLLLLAAWSLALGVTFTPGVEKEAVVVKGAALEIPFFNALLAMHLKPREVEEIQDFRGPLNTGLRLVEDIPELLIGGLDLLYFGGAWYAWLGIACSMMMILFHLFVGIFLTCRQSAMWVAQIGRPLETE